MSGVPSSIFAPIQGALTLLSPRSCDLQTSRGAKLLADEGKTDLVKSLYELALEAIEDEGGVDSSSAGSLVITSQDLFGAYTKLLVESKLLQDAARNELRHAAFVSSLSSFNGSRYALRRFASLDSKRQNVQPS